MPEIDPARAMTLDEFASISAALEAGLPRDEILGEAGFTPEAWDAAQVQWLATLAEQAAEGRLQASRRVVELVGKKHPDAAAKARRVKRRLPGQVPIAPAAPRAPRLTTASEKVVPAALRKPHGAARMPDVPPPLQGGAQAPPAMITAVPARKEAEPEGTAVVDLNALLALQAKAMPFAPAEQDEDEVRTVRPPPPADGALPFTAAVADTTTPFARASAPEAVLPFAPAAAGGPPPPAPVPPVRPLPTSAEETAPPLLFARGAVPFAGAPAAGTPGGATPAPRRQWKTMSDAAAPPSSFQTTGGLPFAATPNLSGADAEATAPPQPSPFARTGLPFASTAAAPASPAEPPTERPPPPIAPPPMTAVAPPPPPPMAAPPPVPPPAMAAAPPPQPPMAAAPLPAPLPPPAMAAAPPPPPAAPAAPAVDPMSRPAVARFSLGDYANLCAGVRTFPTHVPWLQTQFGLTPEEWTALHTLWQGRFQQDPNLRAKWQRLINDRLPYWKRGG